jgi:subtilisin family serine protease
MKQNQTSVFSTLKTVATVSALSISTLSMAKLPVVKKSFLKLETKKRTAPKKKLSTFPYQELSNQYASWGISPANKNTAINLLNAWKSYSKPKKDIVVAVIDTGIDPSHPYLSKRLFVPHGNSGLLNFGMDFSKNRKSKYRPTDTHGHGTHVSGIIRSVFPKVKILTLKYYNPSASGTDNLNSTIDALRYAVDMNVDIINYSGGGPEPALEELRILKRAEKKGILVVAAAGNERSNIDLKRNAYYPASYGLSNIITVTAHDQSGSTLSSSNYGRKSVDISAPGYRIKSALPHGRSGFLTGTSQATAFVSGAAALIMSQYKELSAKNVKNIIKLSAKKRNNLASKCQSGGILDTFAAQSLARSTNTKIRFARLQRLKKLRLSANQKKLTRAVANKKKAGKVIYRYKKAN